VKWAETYLENNHPEDALFFEPVLKRDSPGYRIRRTATNWVELTAGDDSPEQRRDAFRGANRPNLHTNSLVCS
jgi:hypothetical protein